MQLGLVKFVDKYAGSFACLVLGIIRSPAMLLSGRFNPEKAKKILVIQLWGIGESITTVPAIKSLKKKFPDSEIEILATARNKDVYFGNKDITKVIEIEPGFFQLMKLAKRNFRKYDLIVDMEEYLNASAFVSFFIGRERVGFDHGFRSLMYTRKTRYNDMQHSVFAFLDLAAKVGGDKKAIALGNLNFSKEDEQEVKNFMNDKRISKKDFIIGIAPGAAESAPSRKWPKERYAKLADSLLRKYKKAKIVFIGSSDERALVEEIFIVMDTKKRVYDAAGIFTLKQTFAMIKKCSAFIGNDSGPMHIAAAQGVKTIGLFGPNTPVRWAPFGKGNAFVYIGKNICDFSPCINTHKGQVPDCFYRRASLDYQKCMKAIDVDRVMMTFAKLNRKAGKKSK